MKKEKPNMASFNAVQNNTSLKPSILEDVESESFNAVQNNTSLKQSLKALKTV